MGGKGKHHHHGGHGRRGFRRFRGGPVILDYGPEYFEPACVRVVGPLGPYWHCPPTSNEAGHIPFADTMGLEAGFLPTFVLPDDARRAIQENEAGYDRLNLAITGSGAAPEFKASWSIQYAAFKTFATGAKADVGFFNTTAVMDQNDRFASQLIDWNKNFATVAGVPAPGPLPPPPGQGVPDRSEKQSVLSEATVLVLAGAALAAIVVFGGRSRPSLVF